MIKDTPEGETKFCTHLGYNTTSPCKDCLGTSTNKEKISSKLAPNKELTREGWKKDFDSRFFNPSIPSPDSIKNFIKNLLQEERQRVSEGVEKECEGGDFMSGDYISKRKVLEIINNTQ